LTARPGYAAFQARGFGAKSIGARPGFALEILTDFAASQREIGAG